MTCVYNTVLAARLNSSDEYYTFSAITLAGLLTNAPINPLVDPFSCHQTECTEQLSKVCVARHT